MSRRWAFLRIVFGQSELKENAMADINKTDWSPNRKVVSQAAAMLVLFVTGAFLTLNDIELDIPLGIETALAVVLGYLIPDKLRTVTTVEHSEQTQVVETDVPDTGPE